MSEHWMFTTADNIKKQDIQNLRGKDRLINILLVL